MYSYLLILCSIIGILIIFTFLIDKLCKDNYNSGLMPALSSINSTIIIMITVITVIKLANNNILYISIIAILMILSIINTYLITKIMNHYSEMNDAASIFGMAQFISGITCASLIILNIVKIFNLGNI